ncbi:hypothetical protein ACJJTC_015083 [Scirpophaga incertulas]
MLGRRLRGRLDLLRPDATERVRDRQLVEEQRRNTPLRVVVEESKGQGRSDIDTPKEGSSEDQAFDSGEEVVDDGTEPSAKSPENTAHIINTRPSSRAAALRCREKLAKI